MGLLSNPETRSKISQFIEKRGGALSMLLFIGGAVWFLALSHPGYNGGVYFSENALLPGLVNTEFTGSGLKEYADNYRGQFKKIKSDSEVPTKWLMNELTAIGLEVYTQTYQFTYPMNLLNNQTLNGENVYGILRAPRASSLESMVMMAPLRPSDTGLVSTDASVALILAMAKHMKKHTYWSKDILFLFTQHEFIGVQAWLDGYFGVSSSAHIKPGRIPARGGLLQAAINLEFDTLNFGAIDVLMEGINGNLPNLDLVNVVHKLARESRVESRIHNRPNLDTYDVTELVKYNILTTFTMMAHQATGMASGNHGLFLRYRVDSLTIKGIPGSKHRLVTAGEIVEGVFRSINNLLEKFHQSFFFYLLPCTYRYISIGLYIPPFGLMAAAGLVQALALWHHFSYSVASRDDKLKTNKDQAFNADGNFTEDALRTVRLPDSVLQGVYQLLPLIIGCHLSGLMILKAPEFFGGGEIKQLPAIDAVILGALACVISSMILVRTIVRKEEFDDLNWQLFKSLILIYHGLVLFSLSLLNISMAVFVTVFTTPIYCIVRPRSSRIVTLLQALLLLIALPLGTVAIAQVIYNIATGSMSLDTIALSEVMLNTRDSIVYALIDHLVFNNYIMYVVSLILYPIWLMMWSVIWMNV